MDKKAIFKILTIFVLGMAIGAFVMGAVVKDRMNRIDRHHAGSGFSKILVKISQVEGKEKEQLIELGNEYGNQLKVLEKEYLENRANVLNEVEQKGNRFLTGAAKERFQHHLHKMKNGPRSRRARGEN